MQAVRKSLPPFQMEGETPRDPGKKKAAPSEAPLSPKEILIPLSLPDWITLYPNCQVENCNRYCVFSRPLTSDSRNSGSAAGRNCSDRKEQFHRPRRSEEHTSELQSPYVISYAVFC